MPFTPFHLGPGLALGMIFSRFVNIPAVLLASVVVDARAIYCFFTGCSLHGFFHTFAGAAIVCLPVIALIYFSRENLSKISRIMRIEQNYSLKSITAGAIAGAWVHILLDAFLYPGIHPFFPAKGNALLFGILGNSEVYLLCMLGFLIGGLIYLGRLFKN